MINERSRLVGGGLSALRDPVVAVVEAGLNAAARIDVELERRVRFTGGTLEVDGESIPVGPGGRVRVLGAGKATLAIASALEEQLGDVLADGLVVVRRHDGRRLRRIEVAEADHPVPSEDSLAAGRRLLALAGELEEGDVLIACFTGGSSALASVPAPGISFDEKRRLHELLLASGAAIQEINSVRKHVSAIKGGRVALAAEPARVVNFTLSDVAGDPLDAITDPTVEDTTSAGDAIGVLEAYGLWDEVAPSIRAHLTDRDASRNVELAHGDPPTAMLVDGRSVAAAMSAASASLGFEPTVLSCRLVGEARTVGELLGGLATDSHDRGEPFAGRGMLLGCGGESTVTLRSATPGLGGPNQEAAIAASFLLAPGRRVAAAFVDTDGCDGGSRFAGAICDGLTVERAASARVDLSAALRSHRASEALAALGDLVETGPTGTNVNDLFAIAIDGPNGAEVRR